MRRLINIELSKLLPYSGFWVPAILWFCLYIAAVFIATQISIDLPGLNFYDLFRFPHLWNVTSWTASWFNLLLAIMIMIYTSNEFSCRMFRQHIIDGFTRNELFLGKLSLIVIFSASATVLVFITTLITGVFYNTSESWKLFFDNSYLILVFFAQSFAYMSVGLFISLLLKNIALSIIIFILYFFPVEPIIRNFFPDEILFFFPMKVISNLTPPPDVFSISSHAQFLTTVNGQVINSQQQIEQFEVPLWGNTIAAIIYIALFLTLSHQILRTKRL